MYGPWKFIGTRGFRRPLKWATQFVIFATCGLAAFLLRSDFSLPQAYLRYLAYALPVWVAVKLMVFRFVTFDRGLWRYLSVTDLFWLAVGNLAASSMAAVILVSIGPQGFPRSVFILDLMICFLAMAGLRLIVRMVAEAVMESARRKRGKRNTLIYGAGAAGLSLLREIRNNPKLDYRVVGFLDDAPGKQGRSINGFPVLGGEAQVEALVTKHAVEMILIAIPSAAGFEMTRMLKACHAAGVECKTVPSLGEMIESRGLAGQIREVAVADLLGRTPVRLEEKQIGAAIQGKVVLVTGAAGSIGSELCRQIARFHPAMIVGFDSAESPLFEIEREMRQSFPLVSFFAEIGSIQNRSRLHDLFTQYRPNALYHAAAYKHVPLMEDHVFEAVENNIFGTYNVAVAAKAHGVENFVLISSDKAVRPTNVMGVTKRIAEQIILSLQNGGTQYIAVRFGNVLGSNGSVIPIFKKQIAAGGPVTVTHPEMRRFFMTIPEACQLVLQASTIGKGGQICVLDMGQPVKIVDLARNLILLSGLRPDEDIKIEFSGMRPGEKLYEEISSLLEDTVPTDHEKVRIFVGGGMAERDVESCMHLLRGICERRNVGQLLLALKETVLDYSPSTHLLKRVVEAQNTDREVTASAPTVGPAEAGWRSGKGQALDVVSPAHAGIL